MPRYRRASRIAQLAVVGLLLCALACPRPQNIQVNPKQRDSLNFSIGTAASVRVNVASTALAPHEPLIVLDGAPVETRNGENYVFGTLEPADIQSVEVIRGSTATSIYGSRAANGVVLIVSGYSTEQPKVEEFPAPALRFRLGGNRELVRAYVEARLRESRIPWTNQVDDPLVYVITALTSEPPVARVNRERRAAVLLRLNQDQGANTCSDVALSWLRKSRGYGERTWRARDEDQQESMPALVETIARWLESDSLRQGCK